MAKLVYGVGINDKSKPSMVDGKLIKEYVVWKNMIFRCYSEEYKKKYPTYIGCTVSENFKNYSYFYNWYNNQTNLDGNLNFELDKDLLIKGNKIYSEDTCTLLPKEINYLLNKNKAKRGEYPIGVSLHNATGRFVAKIKKEAKLFCIGYFNNPVDAFIAYKKEKESHIIFMANKYRNLLSDSAYTALLNYRVKLDD